MKDKLTKIITKDIRSKKCISDFKRVRGQLYKDMAKYQPGLCEDESINMIAFNAGSKRMKIKTGRFLSKKLGLNHTFYTPIQIEDLASKINLVFWGMNEGGFRLVSGKDIQHAYYNETGGSSCMTDSEDYTQLYADNPEVYRMLIFEQGNMQARAMVVKLDNGKYLLDRIYCNDSGLFDEMQKYAFNQGWYVRGSMGASSYGVVDKSGKEVDYNDLVVTGLIYKEGGVPYQDTLRKGSIVGDKLCIQHSLANSTYYDFTITSTEGYIEDGCTCVRCGEYMSEGDSYYVDCIEGDVCEECLDNFTYCDACGEYQFADCTVYIEDLEVYVCENCSNDRDNYVHCEDCGKWYSADQARWLDGVDRDICDNCKDKYVRCEDCREYHHIDNNHFIENAEKNVCNDCLENYPECADCGERFLQDDLTEHEGELLCSDCLSEKTETERV